MSTPAPVETWIFTAAGFLRRSMGEGMEEVDSRQFKVESKQKQNQEKTGKNYASEIWRITHDSLGLCHFDFQLSTVDFPFSQHSPGGIGFPCGQVLGWPRKVQMRWSSSGLMMCSNLQA